MTWSNFWWSGRAGRASFLHRAPLAARRSPSRWAAGLMKSTIAMAIMAASLLLTGCGKVGNTPAERIAKEVGESQVIAYATTGRSTRTNILLTVTEIWKGSEEAAGLGLTNGMQFLEDNPGGSLPEAAIILSSADTNHQSLTGLNPQWQSTWWVRAGRIEPMTVQEFKAKFGL